MAQDYKELHRLAVEERRQLNDRMANVSRYDGEMDARALSPNGDDYNAIIAMLRGEPYRDPHTKGR